MFLPAVIRVYNNSMQVYGISFFSLAPYKRVSIKNTKDAGDLIVRNNFVMLPVVYVFFQNGIVEIFPGRIAVFFMKNFCLLKKPVNSKPVI